MQDNEKQPEFSLEDILREFGSHSEEPAAEQPAESAEPAAEAAEEYPDLPEFDPGPDLIPIADEDRVSLEEEEPIPAAGDAPVSGDLERALADVLADKTPEPLTPAGADAPGADAPSDADVQVFVPKKPAPAAAGGDTIRLDTAGVRSAIRQQADLSSETVRIDTDAVSAMTGETVRLDTAAVAALAGSGESCDAMTAETVRLDYDQVNAMTAETVRLDYDQVNAMTAETVRLDYDQVNAMTAETVRLDTGAVQAAAAQAPKSDIPAGAEPFSDSWEPTYEEPIGEYIPPEPIVFRPRSRFQELKKKLIAGPERRYYTLVEAGVGKLQIAIFISLLIVILSTVSIGLNQMNMVQPERMRLLVFGELFAMLFSAVLASDLLFNGFVSIFRGRFNLHSLLAMSFLVCMADGVFCLKGVRVPYCSAFCLEVTAALWAEYQHRTTEMGQMDTLRKATRLNRIAKAPGCFDGRPGFYQESGEVEDFMDTYNQPSRPGRMLNLYALLTFLASIGIGVLAYVTRGDIAYGLQMWSAAILSAAPATIFLCHSRPAAILEHRLHRFGVVLCGWKGVSGACGSAVIPLRDEDLFPAGSVKVNGVKIYSKRDPDQVISYATALVERSDTCLAGLFSQLRDSRYGQHYEAENFRVYENGGFGGDVNGESVLVGRLSFLQEIGVHIPDGALVEHAVYAAINGELCGVFAMAFGKLKGVSAGLATLCDQRRIAPIISTDNFLVTEDFLREKFGVNTRRVVFPSCQQRSELAAWTPDREAASVCALSTQESLAATGFAITGSRALATALRLGTAVHMFGGIVGMLIVLVLQFVDGGSLLTPANLLLFELIWAVPGLLLTEWTRGL